MGILQGPSQVRLLMILYLAISKLSENFPTFIPSSISGSNRFMIELVFPGNCRLILVMLENSQPVCSYGLVDAIYITAIRCNIGSQAPAFSLHINCLTVEQPKRRLSQKGLLTSASLGQWMRRCASWLGLS